MEQKVWKREAGFDQIEIPAEMDAQRFRTGFDLEPVSTKLYNPRWSHTPAEYALEMNAEVEGLRIKLPFSSRRRRNVVHRCDGRPWSVRG